MHPGSGGLQWRRDDGSDDLSCSFQSMVDVWSRKPRSVWLEWAGMYPCSCGLRWGWVNRHCRLSLPQQPVVREGLSGGQSRAVWLGGSAEFSDSGGLQWRRRHRAGVLSAGRELLVHRGKSRFRLGLGWAGVHADHESDQCVQLVPVCAGKVPVKLGKQRQDITILSLFSGIAIIFWFLYHICN